MICRNDISNLKTDINDKIGQKIIVKGSLGRSKEFAKEGTIEKAYSNLFVVKYEENDPKYIKAKEELIKLFDEKEEDFKTVFNAVKSKFNY